MLKFQFRDEPAGSLGLTPGAIDWLANAYFPAKLEAAIKNVAFEREKRGYTFNKDWHKTAIMLMPDGNVADLIVDVVIHPDAWLDPFGRPVWGLFWSPVTMWASPRVEIAWKPDFEGNNGVTMHELVHMVEYYDIASPTWWIDWQHSLHGRFSKDSYGNIQDPFLIACNMQIAEGYPLPVNHSYHPGALPCSLVGPAVYASRIEDPNSLARVDLYSDGHLEVYAASYARIPELEKSVRECAHEILKRTDTTTVYRYIHTPTNYPCELTRNQFMDRLLMFL
jgi:hypothetical protein